MSDLSETLAAKSDQLTADDLLAGPRTITVAAVSVQVGSEQPVTLRFDGDENRGYRPCKIMRRALVQCWGPDGAQYVGRSMTLYRDPEVMFGAVKTGGIRISHLSHISEPVTLPLMVKKGQRRPHRVEPLVQTAAPDRATTVATDLIARVDAIETGPALYALVDDSKVQEQRAWLKAKRPELHIDVEAAFMAAQQRVGQVKEGVPASPAPRG